MAKKYRGQMSHQFSQVPKAEIPRSSFDRSHGVKTTLDEAGYLYPVFVDEVLPGDTFNLSMHGFARMATPIYPLMDNIYIESFFFFVPNRLLWQNWQKFNGEQEDPGDSTDFLVPGLIKTGHDEGTLMDYMGIPTKTANLDISCLPFRAYNLIWNEWFRDQNLQDSAVVGQGGGPDAPTLYPIRKRGKRHDYFTSCLPFPQKGDDVTIPLGTQAPITGIGILNTGVFNPVAKDVRETDGTTRSYAFNTDSSLDNIVIEGTGISASDTPLIYADLTNATAVTINQLRQAFQIQKLYERDARGGTRYTEIVRAHFGVTSPDARLQRPEFLGGGRAAVNINPVAQTQRTDDGQTPQGNLAAYGTSIMRDQGFTKSFTEHGVLLGLVSIRADLTYQQGLNRMWSRRTRFDYYWPALSHIGEQAVLNKEIYAQGNSFDDEVFGYQEAYAEYRYKPSQITGKFRSSDPQSLDVWHLAQDFESLPLLNAEFIEENPPMDRVVAVPSEPKFILDAWFNLRCARPMPLYGVPGMIDHF